MTILEKTLEECRKALLSGVPILYINTDSDVFIRKLIGNEQNPLVVLLSNSGMQGTKEEKKLKELRPLYEMERTEDRYVKKAVNYKAKYPTVDDSGTYADLRIYETEEGGVKQVERKIGPVLWVYKVDSEKANTDSGRRELASAFAALEKYVADRDDPYHPQRAYLQSSVVILYSAQVMLSPGLRPYTRFIEAGYPEDEELRQIILSESDGDKNLVGDEAYLSSLSTALQGFTAEETALTVQGIKSVIGFAKKKDVLDMIAERKKQKLVGGILELCDTSSEIGGMERFKEWLSSLKDVANHSGLYMSRLGTPPPKGVLLCGIPGCGKSEAARATAETLGQPLLKMDIGSLMDKYQGVSEQQMREALALAEAMAPCVLWIDELEKGFSAAESGGKDNGTFKRMFGYMLGWMQDNKKPCFIFATANDIGGLPKEFFRSGRFDALYGVYLPTAEECVDIFIACMHKAEKNAANARNIKVKDVRLFQEGCKDRERLRRIVNECFVEKDGNPRIVIGSDIQQIVNIALRDKFNDAEDRGWPGISAGDFETALRKAVAQESFAVYGDGNENIESIAISYCRMLRKGFIPTTKNGRELFRRKEYHTENAREYAQLKSQSTDLMSDEEKRRHQKRLNDLNILEKRKGSFEDKYDEAVYNFLLERINQIAKELEQRERELLIMG